MERSLIQCSLSLVPDYEIYLYFLNYILLLQAQQQIRGLKIMFLAYLLLTFHLIIGITLRGRYQPLEDRVLCILRHSNVMVLYAQEALKMC